MAFHDGIMDFGSQANTADSAIVPEQPGRRNSALLDQAFTRAAGAPLVMGNGVRLLKDATENYPVWLAAIRSAEHRIYFENYIFREDEIGAEFAAALQAKARDGLCVRVIYDWMGGLGKASRRFWRALREAGVEVRCFNPLRFSNPFDWVHRDHRKTIAVDGRVGFISGLCVDRLWAGRPERGIEPWRDTGIVYIQSDIPKSQIYLESLPLFTRGLVRLPDHQTLLRELRLLERQTHRGGKDSVDHPRGAHDDYANATCGVLRTLSNYLGFSLERMIDDGEENTQARQQSAADQWHQHRMFPYS